ncbi:MAG TPA: sterol desaturase family protein [Acetobacteraceae bacterium]|nr:sterol desaturase family protein [Acetobacteraceae bacterium]
MKHQYLASSELWQDLAQQAWSHVSGVNGAMILIFWGVLVFAAAVTFLRLPGPHSVRGLIAHILPQASLRHPSARADFLFWLSRRVFMPLLVLPTALSTVTAGHVAYRLLGWLIGHRAHPPEPAGLWTLLAFTVTMFLAYDLSYYVYHYLQHRIPLLWELHKVHHSAEVMVGVTKDRVHPIDEIMNRWWNGIIPGLAYGVWLYFALDPVELTVFGLNIYFLSNTVLMMDFVRHTHLKLSYGQWVNCLLLCPHFHQLHHSVARQHWDKNFGLTLSIWDRMFGTLVVPAPDEEFTFGLPGGEAAEYQSLTRLHLLPLKKIALLVYRHGTACADAKPLATRNMQAPS